MLLMIAVTAMSAVLALRYDSLAIAAMGMVGGYLTPLLLSTGEDRPWFLFSYLLVLNVAATELAGRRNWRPLELISFVATALIYTGWLFEKGDKPDNRLIATFAPIAFCVQRWRTFSFWPSSAFPCSIAGCSPILILIACLPISAFLLSQCPPPVSSLLLVRQCRC
jgi:hypothetical protein